MAQLSAKLLHQGPPQQFPRLACHDHGPRPFGAEPAIDAGLTDWRRFARKLDAMTMGEGRSDVLRGHLRPDGTQDARRDVAAARVRDRPPAAGPGAPPPDLTPNTSPFKVVPLRPGGPGVERVTAAGEPTEGRPTAPVRKSDGRRCPCFEPNGESGSLPLPRERSSSVSGNSGSLTRRKDRRPGHAPRVLRVGTEPSRTTTTMSATAARPGVSRVPSRWMFAARIATRPRPSAPRTTCSAPPAGHTLLRRPCSPAGRR